MKAAIDLVISCSRETRVDNLLISISISLSNTMYSNNTYQEAISKKYDWSS